MAWSFENDSRVNHRPELKQSAPNPSSAKGDPADWRKRREAGFFNRSAEDTERQKDEGMSFFMGNSGDQEKRAVVVSVFSLAPRALCPLRLNDLFSSIRALAETRRRGEGREANLGIALSKTVSLEAISNE